MRALITGAASGLAKGVAVAFARSDLFEHIAITYRNEPADTTQQAIAKENSAVTTSAHHIDFLDTPSNILAALEKAIVQNGPFDVLVHGVGPMVIKRFADSTVEDYNDMFNGNVRSAMLTAQAVLPAMRERRFGRIVVFGMHGSSITQPTKNFSLHLAAKSGLVAFAKTLAIEEASHGITVNVIEPGDIRDKTITRAEALAQTEPAKNPRGRPGTWEDIAGAVLFFVDPTRDFVTGTVLAVDGGWR